MSAFPRYAAFFERDRTGEHEPLTLANLERDSAMSAWLATSRLPTVPLPAIRRLQDAPVHRGQNAAAGN